MTFWNSDGSPAAMCGNAALCSTRLAAHLEMVPSSGMSLATDAGPFPTRCVATGTWPRLNLPDFDLPAPCRGWPSPPANSGFGRPWWGPASGDPGGGPRRVRPPGPGTGPAVRSSLAPTGPTSTSWPNPPLPAAPGSSGPTSEGWRRRPWPVAPARWPPRSPWLPRGGGAAHDLRFQRGGRELFVRATIKGGRATDVWLRGEGRLVFTGTLTG